MFYFIQRLFFGTLLTYLFIFSFSNLVAKDTDHAGSMPLVFRKNVGQWDKDILYKGSSSSANVFFTKSGMVVAHTRKIKSLLPERKDELENLYWKINFEGALEQTTVTPAAMASSYTNYLVGTTDKHRSNIPDYNELRYESIYKGIDLHYYSVKNELKYDFILSPGADMENIRLNCEEIKNMRINKNGELEITHKWGTVLEKKPYSYQEIEGKKIEVDIRYEIKKKNTYGYKIYGKYDPSKTIVIDPLSITWGTYVGGNNSTVSGYQYDIAVDNAGNAYGTGYYPASFPTTSNAYDQSFNGGYGDVFVYKMDAGGSNLIYATYVGGNDDDRGMSIAVNGAGEAFVAGYSFSAPSGFPHTTLFGGTASSSNAFVFKLNSSGSGLIYSVIMGANDQESALALALNSSNEVIVVGETKSYNFPMATATYDNTYNGGAYDGFFVKLNAAGNAMLSSGFLGGTSDDRAKGVAVDQNNNVYITGYTASSNFPVSAGAYDNSHNGGLDAFVMKFNTTVTTPQYSTFIGGIYDEESRAIDVTPQGEAVITGYTFSNTFPKTDGSSYKGLKDMFLTRFNAAGSLIVYSKTIGGNGNDEATSVETDTSGYVYMAGMSESTNITAWAKNLGQDNSIVNGEYNVYFGIFCKDGKMFENVFLGGSKDDYNKPSIGMKSKERVCDIVLGFTSHSDNLPTTNGIYQKTKLNGGVENDQLALFKIMVSKDTIYPRENHIKPICGPQTRTFCLSDSIIKFCDTIIQQKCHTFKFPNPNMSAGDTAQSINGCTYREYGYSYQYVDTSKAYIKKPLTFCKGQTATLYAIDEDGNTVYVGGGIPPTNIKLLWSNGGTDNSIVISVPGKYWLRTTNVCGYVFYDTIVVKEIDKPSLDLGADKIICFPGSITLNAANINDTLPTKYNWTTFGQISSSINVNQPGTYCVDKSNKCGSVNDCIDINPVYKPSVNLGNDTSLCNGIPIALDAGNPGSTYAWSPGGQITKSITVSSAGSYSVVVTNSCGTATDQINVGLVATPPNVNLGADLLLCSPGDFPHLLDAGNAGSNYYWSTSSKNQTITVNSGGQYFVTVTNGCGIDMDTLTITAPPSLGLNLGPDTILCGPATLTLNAGNTGATYLWSPGGQTSQTKTINSTGSYSVTVTNACGNASDNINVTIQNGSPLVNLGPDKSICVGTPTTLTAGSVSGQTYVWSTGATSPSITVSSVGIYWVDVTNKCGTVRDSIRLTNGLPSFSLGPDKFVCSPATVSLSVAGAGTSFAWSTLSSAPSITVSSTGIYWVDVSNTCGTVRDSVYVSVSAGAPNVNLGPDQLQCSAFSVVLDAANAGSTYLWSPGGQSTQTITVNTGGQYIAKATNGCGTDSDTLLIITQPLAVLGPDRNVCQGNSLTLDAGNPGSTYLWTPAGETTQTIAVNTTGNYGVTVTNACGSVSDNIHIGIITAAPTVNLGPDVRVCAPLSATIDAGNAGATYAWSTGATSQTIAVSASGNYSVTITNACGMNSDNINVLVDTGIPVVNLGVDQTLCKPVFILLDAGAGATSYSWSTGAGSQTVNVTSSGNYSVTVTNACGNASDNILIMAIDPPVISLKDTGGCINPVVLDARNTGSGYFWAPGGQMTQTISAATTGAYTLNLSNACGLFSKTIQVIINTTVPSFNLGADTNLCTPAGLKLNAGLQPGGKYIWTPNGDTTQTITVKQAGNYSATVTNYCGSSMDNITIAANPVAVNARYDDTICIGASVKLYTDSLPAYTYSWTPVSSLKNSFTPSPTATPSSTTNYYVTTSNGTCFNIDSVLINVDIPISPDIDIFPPSKEGFVPLTIAFKDRNNAGVSYIWNFDDGDTSQSHLLNPKHTFKSENYFHVHVTSITENGCKAYDSIIIKAFTLYIPNLITPNGDGKNDRWEITKLHERLNVEIYNRWGDRVYKYDNYIDQWDGGDLSDGVYYYMVEDKIYGKTYKGWVEIMRGDSEK